MTALVDTHAFLWFAADDRRLPEHVAQIIEGANNRCYLSIASIWELAIKISLGKLQLTLPLQEFLEDQVPRSGIEILDLRVAHAVKVADLPFHHRDPFDRLLIAQALVEGVPLISVDPVLDAYGVCRIW